MFTDQHDQGTSNSLIGALVALIAALGAYVAKLKAAVSRQTGKKVSVEDAIRSMVLETVAIEIKKAPWSEAVSDVVTESVAHEFRNSESFKSVDRRLAALEFQRDEDRRETQRNFDDLKRALGEVKSRLPAA